VGLKTRTELTLPFRLFGKSVGWNHPARHNRPRAYEAALTNLTRDPKGYYVALGIAEDADADAIKSAYRTKAKRLHPDFNPSPIAAKQFHRLHEAYATLSDPATRAVYDRPWKAAGAKPEKQEKKAHARPETKRAESQEQSSAQAQAPTGQQGKPAARAAGSIDEPAVCQCGKITAQPRFVVFDQVWGRLKRVHRRTVSGIYCRTCADRAAVKASLITWLAGWWAWPDGPKETVKALITNIRGGRKPADRNARLLLRQARAFRARGEMELARSAAEQALTFAGPGLRGEVDAVLAPLGGYSRVIRDRWSKPGWAPMVQVLPLAVIVAALSTLLSYSTPTPLSTMVRDFYGRSTLTAPQTPPATKVPVGRVYTVTADGAALRTGPGANYHLDALLKAGTLVLATETSPDGRWLRVATTDGAAGFMTVSDLSADVPVDVLNDVDGFAGAVKNETVAD